MLIFAQPGDVERWAGQTIDDDVVPLIRSASVLVQHAVRGAMFDVSPSGMPEDPDVMDALRDATCEQVAMWVENEINPARVESASVGVTSSSIGDASVSYNTDSAGAVRDQMARELCEEAILILANAGLLGGFPWVR